MSGIGAALAKPVGPMPLGAWLVVGAGGLFLAYKSRGDEPQVTREVQQVPVPVGAIASQDMSPTVLVTPVIRLPDVTTSPAPVDLGAAPVMPDTALVPAAPAPAATPTPAAPAAPLPPSTLTTVLRPSGNIVTTNLSPHPYPTAPAPNGKRVVRDGSGREWVTEGSRPGVTGYVWNRNTGRWQAR